MERIEKHPHHPSSERHAVQRETGRDTRFASDTLRRALPWRRTLPVLRREPGGTWRFLR